MLTTVFIKKVQVQIGQKYEDDVDIVVYDYAEDDSATKTTTTTLMTLRRVPAGLLATPSTLIDARPASMVNFCAPGDFRQTRRTHGHQEICTCIY